MQVIFFPFYFGTVPEMLSDRDLFRFMDFIVINANSSEGYGSN